MNNNQEPWYYSWIVIVLAFLFFWPIGVVLIILKSQNKSKNSLFTGGTNKKIYLAAGVILILWGLMNLRSNTMWGLFMIVGGGLLVYYAEKLAKRATRNKQYINLIVNQQETSIDKIASVCNVQYAIAVKELNQLVSLGALQYTTIDEAHHSITVNRPALTEQNTAAPTLAGAINNLGNGIQNAFNSATGQNGNANPNMEPASKIVTCPGCGAKVTLNRGQVINCEYCDTPISFQ